MKNLRNYIGLLVCIIIFSGCLLSASWQDMACYNDKNCKEASDNYTKPYCITNNIGGETINYANQCVWPVLTNTFSNAGDLPLSDFWKELVVEKFCLSLYGNMDEGRIYFAKPNNIDGEWDWQQTFDSHQSLFLYALCSSFTQSGNKHPFVNDNALVKDVFTGNLVKILNLEQISDGKDSCSLDENQFSKCDLSIYATKIYAAIMSDLYKIKYAQVLDVDTSKDFSSLRDKKLEDFMTGYAFSKKDVAEKYQDLKNYTPKTVSILKSNQMYYKNILDTVKVIDNSLLAERAEQSQCPIAGNMTGIDFIACALHSSQKKGLASTPSFLTLIYNEILHYRQFVLYYQEWVKKSKKIGLESELLDFDWYSSRQIDATKSVQQDFQEFSMTYPLHIGILMYIERVENFRNTSLSKIITSFYSLSEKLQNVQEPSS